MSILKTRNNKKFGYNPRYFETEDGKSPYAIEHKFDKHRTTVGKQNFKSNFSNAMNDLKSSRTRGVNRTILILILLLSLFFLWIIDFDLSLFASHI